MEPAGPLVLLLVAMVAFGLGRRGRGAPPSTVTTGPLDVVSDDTADEADGPWRTEFVDALNQPALLIDTDGRVRAANGAARELLGLSGSALGASILESTASTGIADVVGRVRSSRAPLTVDVERAGRELRVSASLVDDETLVVLSDRTRASGRSRTCVATSSSTHPTSSRPR